MLDQPGVDLWNPAVEVGESVQAWIENLGVEGGAFAGHTWFSWDQRALHPHDGDPQPLEVVRITGDELQAVRARHRRDEEVAGPSPRPRPGRQDGDDQRAVRASGWR